MRTQKTILSQDSNKTMNHHNNMITRIAAITAANETAIAEAREACRQAELLFGDAERNIATLSPEVRTAMLAEGERQNAIAEAAFERVRAGNVEILAMLDQVAGEVVRRIDDRIRELQAHIFAVNGRGADPLRAAQAVYAAAKAIA